VIFVLLPIRPESVAWITGRVDSLPTLFYFASFLLYVRSIRPKRTSHRREPASGRLSLLWSVILFFAALFSKQNTITMVPALVLFDWVVRRRQSRSRGRGCARISVHRAHDWLPHAALRRVS
jgi:hypothetical protein